MLRQLATRIERRWSPRIAVSDELRREVRELLRDTNAQLSTRVNMDLAALGY
jgi:hypothetical protein